MLTTSHQEARDLRMGVSSQREQLSYRRFLTHSPRVFTAVWWVPFAEKLLLCCVDRSVREGTLPSRHTITGSIRILHMKKAHQETVSMGNSNPAFLSLYSIFFGDPYNYWSDSRWTHLQRPQQGYAVQVLKYLKSHVNHTLLYTRCLGLGLNYCDKTLWAKASWREKYLFQ